MKTEPLTILKRYGLAVLLVGLAAGLSYYFAPYLERTVFILFFAAVMASSWYGGLKPGILATVLSALVGMYFFLPPAFSFGLQYTANEIQLGLFLLVALLINWLTGARQQALIALRDSEARLQAILDNAPALVYVKALDGRYLLINRHYEQIFGVDRRQVEGKTDHDLFSREMADTYRANDLQVAQSGQAIETEEAAPHADGPHTYISIKFPLYNTAGLPYATCGISTDINERKQAEQEIARLNRDLQRQVSELQTLLDILPVGVCVAHDPACLQMTINPAGARMLSVSTAENPSKSAAHGEQLPFKVLREGVEVATDDLPMQYAANHNTIIRDIEYDIRHHDGTTVTLLEYASPLHDEQGQVRGSVGVFVDVTGMKQAELTERSLAEMRERNRLAQELHDTVAQTLGYLNLKIGLTYNLLQSDDLAGTKANLQELKQVVSETYTDVREEIFYLRSHSLSDLSFMELLNRYVDKYRRFYHLEIQQIHETDPAQFEFPPEVTSQLVRTIQEALINIRKHAHVKTAIIRLGREGNWLRLSIEDEGQGFDPATIQEKTASFGLQIMRERVESVGGSLEIDTAPNQGTRIIIRYK